METLRDTINQRPIVSTGINKVNTIVTTVPIVETKKIKLTKSEVLGCDLALSDYADLMSPEFYAWYCKIFYQIGRERFHILASTARVEGKDKRRYFSSLLKQELAR